MEGPCIEEDDMVDATQRTGVGLAWSLATWFVAGIGLTLGYCFTMWLLRICHLA